MTIRDLAKRAGVSIATASRVLNNYPDVSPETREKVLAQVREMDYHPSAVARALVTSRSNLIGVFFMDHVNTYLLHPFFREVIVGFKQAVGAAGYDLLLFSNVQPNAGDDFIKRARNHGVDGLVLMGIRRQAPGLNDLIASGIPTMCVDLDLMDQRVGFVMSDNTSGAEIAVRHLYSLGHRRIATITGVLATRPAQDRLIGYRNVLRELGISYRPEYVCTGDFTRETGYEAMQALLALPEPPTAVFAAGDLMAIGAMHAVQDAGLTVPNDVALVGFDDIEPASLVRPGLTTMAQDKEGLGATAGNALVRMIDDPAFSPPLVTMQTQLVIRGSCGAVVR